MNTPDFAAQMASAEGLMRENRDVLQELAESAAHARLTGQYHAAADVHAELKRRLAARRKQVLG